ncbi:GATA zinc finger domain-containing protein 14-like isoform X1 [Sitophilus oryzae]|uniref:GATA zinc finger domain-containing protein 14-like isoform X1 n=1 Tax=Sitophilus oryzae TaxID=7048 RepID=A0A6J2XXE6_SITOR|nr:GATA zinc finger domain-containing protein 14-like isoform X1 [Sitophilus oryzae]
MNFCISSCGIMATVWHISAKQLPISDKLDFEDNKTSTTENSPNGTEYSFTCGERGCNVTNSSDSIQTEVLVHVKTKVSFNKTNHSLKNASEVPIYVGYRGSDLDVTGDDRSFRNSPNLIGNSGNENHYFSNLYRPPSRPLNYNYIPPGSFDRSHGQFLGHNYLPQGAFDRNSDNNLNQNYHLSHSTFNRYNDNLNHNYQNIFSRNNDNILNRDYGQQRPISQSYGDVLEQPFPHFDHTYHRHNFGEAPPPHSLLYPRIPTPNPVAFRGISRNEWKPVYRPNKYDYSTHLTPHDSSKCTCEDRSTLSQSRSFIDDKLAPLQ